MNESDAVLWNNPKDANHEVYDGIKSFQSGTDWYLRLPPGHPSGLVYEPTAIQVSQDVAKLYPYERDDAFL